MTKQKALQEPKGVPLISGPYQKFNEESFQQV